MHMKIEKCSYCNSTNLGIGYQMGNGQIYPDLYAYHSAKSGSVVEYIICKDCGRIVCSRVRNPELFPQYSTARHDRKNYGNTLIIMESCFAMKAENCRLYAD